MTNIVARSRRATLAVWSLSLATLAVAGVLAAAFALMAASLDPEEMVTTGVEPWTNAAVAVAAVAAVIVTTALGLALWHTARLRILGAAISVLQAGAVLWACLWFYSEYM